MLTERQRIPSGASLIVPEIIMEFVSGISVHSNLPRNFSRISSRNLHRYLMDSFQGFLWQIHKKVLNFSSKFCTFQKNAQKFSGGILEGEISGVIAEAISKGTFVGISTEIPERICQGSAEATLKEILVGFLEGFFFAKIPVEILEGTLAGISKRILEAIFRESNLKKKSWKVFQKESQGNF